MHTHMNIKYPLLLCLAALASACSSGGGSSSPAAITSWPNPFASQQITASGQSQAGTYYDSGSPAPTIAAPSSGATMTAKLATDGTIAYLELKPTGSTAVVHDNTSTTVDHISASTKVDKITSSNNQNITLFANPVDNQWEYQTYASWITGLTTASGNMGSMSVGWKTASVPTTGTATYSGTASGTYHTGSQVYLTQADMSALADFSARTLSFQTVSTQRYGDITGGSPTQTQIPGLNLLIDTGSNASLTWTSGSNQFSGNIKTSDSSLSGSVSGYFYGPNANEIGGTFKLTNNSNYIYQGAFGAKQ